MNLNAQRALLSRETRRCGGESVVFSFPCRGSQSAVALSAFLFDRKAGTRLVNDCHLLCLLRNESFSFGFAAQEKAARN